MAKRKTKTKSQISWPGRKILWTKRFRIFYDGGRPTYRWIPKFVRSYYDPYWKMRGFRIYWLGREVNFSFGKDINGLYKDTKNYR